MGRLWHRPVHPTHCSGTEAQWLSGRQHCWAPAQFGCG